MRDARGGRVRVFELVEGLLVFVLLATTTVLATRAAARAGAQREDRARIERWRAERLAAAAATPDRLARVLPGDRYAGVLERSPSSIVSGAPWKAVHEEDAAAARHAPARGVRADVATRHARPTEGEQLGDDWPLGVVSIPRLHLEATIRDGSDEETLAVAVGWIPGTSRTVAAGNIGLAAHRDTLFRPLRHVRKGDVVQLETTGGTFDYTVRDVRVVEPEDVWVLNSTERPSLTLVTCYPFNFVGSAPQRFIVRAERHD